MADSSPRGWYRRGYLPHFDGGEILQFITCRLFDSLPQTVLESWKREIDPTNPHAEAEYRKKIEGYLDRGLGRCFLKDRRVAEMVQNSLLFHHQSMFDLFAWVIMPNHMHLLLRPNGGSGLEQIQHSIKSYTAHEANKILNRKGAFWQHESFDRYIRNADHFRNVVRYIELNPVKARLCKMPTDWPWSSASVWPKDQV